MRLVGGERLVVVDGRREDGDAEEGGDVGAG